MAECTFLTRLIVILYDSFLLTAILFFSTFLLMPLTNGQAIASGNVAYNIFLLFIAYIYYCWHWVKGGQTLGMRSWHVHIVDELGVRPDWRKCTLRFMFASVSLVLLGLGFIWSLFDKNKLALHDHLSKTRLVVIKDYS